MIGNFPPLPLPSLKQHWNVFGNGLDRAGLSAEYWQLKKGQLLGKIFRDYPIDTQMKLSGNHRPTYRHAGRDYRLIDISGNVVKGVLP
jgi:hypothetical protein